MTTRFIPAVSDGEILRILKNLGSRYSLTNGQIYIESFQFTIAQIEEEPLKSISKANGYTISQFAIGTGQFNVNYVVAHGLPTSLVKFDTTQNTNQRASPEQFNFLTEITRKFAVPPLTSIDGSATEALAGFKAIETALAGSVSSFAELQASYLTKSDELRTQHAEQLAQLKESYDEAAKKKEDELEEGGRELARLRKELDDRSNTHARRDIRKEIKAAIGESLKGDSFASNVEGKRLYVRISFLVSIGLVLLFAIFSTYALNVAVEGKIIDGIWWLGIKAVIGGISVVGFLLLYLRWEINWLNQRASYEATLASTKIDIDRASWVAESLLEWNRESPDKPIPNELLESFTRRLFDWEAKSEDHQSASDSLASVILGSAARVQIGPSGANLEIDRKGLKSLNKN